MKSMTYLKLRKLILVIFLGLQNFFPIDTSIPTATAATTITTTATTILLHTIFLPSFATSKYINTGDIRISNNSTTSGGTINNPISNSSSSSSSDSSNNNNNNNNNITTKSTNRITNTTNNIDSIQIDKWNDADVASAAKSTAGNTIITTISKNRYKRNNNVNKGNFQNSINSKETTSNDNNNNNNNRNYYYEEQNPLIVMQSESGPITFTDYTGTAKSLNRNHLADNSSEYNDHDVNYYYNTRYTLTTPSGISDLSSEQMDDFERNEDDDNDDDHNYHNAEDESYMDNGTYDDSDYDDKKKYSISKQQSPNDIASFMATAKNVWEIFSVLNTAWTSISSNHNNDHSSSNNVVAAARVSETEKSSNKSSMNEDRNKRNSETAVAEGRYIKGDPLKGYYDFVITEGSYKFWAAFQFATAILIIYSTFAAIYYSKVNPLVGDYDYVDYLGGGRSLSNDESDFVDLPYSESQSGGAYSKSESSSSGSFLSSILNDNGGNSSNWLPRMGHTIKFILDAIEKFPQNENVRGK